MTVKLFCAAAILGLAAACSSDSTEPSPLSQINSIVSPGEFVPSARFNALFDVPRPILDTEFVDLGVAGKLILEQQDGPYARYLSSDLGGIILQHGMLHSMYGFGEPLISAELSEPLALVLAGRAGLADRFHTYLDGEDRTNIRTYRCTVTVVGASEVDYGTEIVKTTTMSESCQSLDQTFENTYWVDRKRGEIVQSRQWAGENVGRIVTRVTFP
jgi:hypothetical protein